MYFRTGKSRAVVVSPKLPHPAKWMNSRSVNLPRKIRFQYSLKGYIVGGRSDYFTIDELEFPYLPVTRILVEA